MCCYCLRISSEHFYLLKMTELALFIMYFCSRAGCSTPLSAARLPGFCFFFSSFVSPFQKKKERTVFNPSCVYLLMWRPHLYAFACLSWLLNKIWHNNWCSVSRKHRYGEYGLLWRWHWLFKKKPLGKMGMTNTEVEHKLVSLFPPPEHAPTEGLLVCKMTGV